MVSFYIAHLGGMDKGVGRAAGPPLRAEPDRLRGGMGRPMGNPFGAILAEVGGEDCKLELSDSSLCRMSLHVSRLLASTLDPRIAKSRAGGGWGGGKGDMQGAVCHVMQAVGNHSAWHMTH